MPVPPASPTSGAPPCPRCAAPSEAGVRARDRNRAVSDRDFDYRRCTACGVLWLGDVPADLAEYYPGDYHDFPDGGALAAAVAAERPKLDLVTAHARGGQLVEIGPSQGLFAAAACDAGFDVVALEMDAECCRHLETVIGVRAVHTVDPAQVLPTLAPSRAVVLWHVIEHLPDPWTALRAVATNLEPGGVLVLSTPNVGSLQWRVFGPRWVHLDAPRHLTLIPLRALADEVAGMGLDLVTATTSDPVGQNLDQLGWVRSILSPPALRPDPRFAWTIGRTLTVAARPVERRGLRGAAYTAVFAKRPA